MTNKAIWNKKWEVMIITLALVLNHTSAFSEGLSGWLNITGSSSKVKEDGAEVSSTGTLNQNYYLNLQEPVTPVLSYQFNLRANIQDAEVAGPGAETPKSYRRTIEPAITFFLRNSVYDINAGYQREETWPTAHFTNDSRETSEFYFSRFNFMPRAFPSLSVNFEKRKEFDHGSDNEKDRKNDTYSFHSLYELPSPDVRFRYYLNYSHNVDKTPLLVTDKTTTDNFNGNYELGYSGAFWKNRANYSAGYQGYFSRSKNRVHVTETGMILFKRDILEAFNIQDATPLTTNIPDTKPLLRDGDYDNPATVSLGSTFQNIGVQIFFDNVDTLYIYYTNAGVADPVRWRIYSSNNNQDWTFIEETASIIPAFDPVGNAYRYEIKFTSASALFFKAVNLDTAKFLGSDVEISEIEVYGTEEITASDSENINVAESFNQRLNFNVSANLLSNLNLSLDYSIDRADQNPDSYIESASGIFKNIFSDSITGTGPAFRSNVSRNYGARAIWMTHRLLTTTARFQRSENFDNLDDTDTYSNTYTLSFNSAPLPTLDTTLSLMRNERYSFTKKDSSDDSYVLSIGTRLYRNINMINDLGYNKSKSFTQNTSSSTYHLNGTVDSRITKEITGNLNYGFSNTSSGNGSSNSKNALMIINYQPGRFINFSGNLHYEDTSADADSAETSGQTTAEGVTMDWLPLPVVRMNLTYQHSNTESKDAAAENTMTDTLSGSGIWYITKFADIHISSGYTRQIENVKTESFNFSININCRF